MQSFWETELSDDDRDALVDKIVAAIKKKGLESPAIFFLESHKPIAPFAAQAMVALSPFLVPFVGVDMVDDCSRLMRKRDNIELVIQALERDDAPRGLEANPTCNT
ncbi:MAG: hypothetical protein JSS65_12570 [Armatimonadetes bacterium]|nr:hypothetical protein [Armatimonadota bacterium]